MDHEEFLLVLEFIHMVILNGGPCHLRMTLCITKREKAESEAQRGKPKGTLEIAIRIAIFVVRTAPSALIHSCSIRK